MRKVAEAARYKIREWYSHCGRMADEPMAEPTATSSGGVRVEIEAGVAVVTIDRPEVRNAIGFATTDELDAALDEILDVGRGGASCSAAAATARSCRVATSRSSVRSARTRTPSRMASRVRRVLDRVAAFPVPGRRRAERARARRRGRGRDRGGHPHRGRRRQDRLQPGDARHHAGMGWRRAARAGDRPGPGAPRDRDRRALRRAGRAAHSGLVDIVVPRATFDDEWRTLAQSDGGHGTRARRAR